MSGFPVSHTATAHGNNDLQRNYERFVLVGLIAASFHLLGIGSYWTSVYFRVEEGARLKDPHGPMRGIYPPPSIVHPSSSPPATDAAVQWIFPRSLQDNNVVSMWVTIPFRFTLKKN